MLVSAVSYLNTWPLVWGFLHGPQRGIFDFRFDLPAQCADALGAGRADIGLVPLAEVDRLGMDFLTDVGIASDGPVRSILLISKRPFEEIRTLSVDSSSRTSVALTRIVLAERYGCRPILSTHQPSLEEMLAENDAALIIGDPALHIDPAALPYNTLDLGSAWVEWTGLPMVFAVWAGRKEILRSAEAEAFKASYEWGRSHVDEMVERAALERGFSREVARAYLTRHIAYELTERRRQGLELFRTLVLKLDGVSASV